MKKTLFIGLILIGLVTTSFSFVVDSAPNEGIFLIAQPNDWVRAGFNNTDYPCYTEDALTTFYMPIALKKEDVHDLKNSDVEHTIQHANTNFTDRLISFNFEILESSLYYVVLYSMKVKASNHTFNIDFIPKIKGEELNQYAWWNSTYKKRVDIWINSSQIDEPLKNFPLYVNTTESTWVALMDGGDSIRFVHNDNLTEYYYEIEDITATSLDAWVNVTSVSNVADTHLNMYFNNSAVSDNQTPASVWDSNYTGVYHMAVTSGNLYDSSRNILNGTLQGTPTYQQESKVGKGIVFSDDDYFTNVLLKEDITENSFTIEYWCVSNGLDDTNIVTGCYYSSARSYFGQSTAGAGTWAVGWGDDYAYIVGVPDTNWNHFAFVTQADYDLDVYYNNIDLTPTEGDVPVTSNSFNTENNYNIGRGIDNGTTRNWIGSITEVRFSKIIRSRGWLNASYGNIQNKSTFIKFGTIKTTAGANDPPSFSNPNPVNRSVNIDVNVPEFNITINDNDGDTFNWTIESSNGLSSSADNEANGTKSLTLSGLIFSEKYTIWVNATDGIDITSRWYIFTTERYILEGEEIQYDMSSIRVGASPPSDTLMSAGASGDIEIFTMQFDPSGANDEELFFTMHLPDDANDSINSEFHLIWFTDDWDGGYYSWNIDFIVKSEADEYGGDYNRTTGTPDTSTINVTPSGNNEFMETDFYQGINIDAEEVVYIRLYLDKSKSSATKMGYVVFVEIKYFPVNETVYLTEDDFMDIGIVAEQLGMFLTLVIFMFFFWIGYKEERKPSGGIFMIFSGFTLIAFEFASLSYLNAVYVIPLISPFAIFIILMGIRKWLYCTEEEKKRKKTEGG